MTQRDYVAEQVARNLAAEDRLRARNPKAAELVDYTDVPGDWFVEQVEAALDAEHCYCCDDHCQRKRG